MTILGENGLPALREIRQARRIIRNDLAQRLKVSLSLATKITAGLLEHGLICESGRAEVEAGGRPANLISLAPDAGYAIGIELDPRRLVAVLLDLTGAQVAVMEPARLALEDREAVLNCIQSLSAQVIAQAGVDPKKVFGLGISLPRTVDPVTGTTYGWLNGPSAEQVWAEFPLREALRPRLPFQHILVDDVVRALGMAEAHYGVDRLKEDFVYLLLDNGIGMAFMVAGQPYIGYSHIAMEIGHVPIQGRDVRCACGNIGCLEELASASSVLRRLHERIEHSPVQSVLRSNGGPGIEEVIEAAENSDKLAYPLMIEVGEDVGKALGIVVNLLGPRLVVVGGSLAASDVLLDAARRELKLRALQQASRVVELRRTELDTLAAARGAATQALNVLFEPDQQHLLALYGIP